MALAEEYRIGHTKIKIFDDCLKVGEEEIEQALKGVTAIIGRGLGASVQIQIKKTKEAI